jgi:hypothetical protein
MQMIRLSLLSTPPPVRLPFVLALLWKCGAVQSKKRRGREANRRSQRAEAAAG